MRNAAAGVAVLLLLAGCASSRVTRGDGQTIAQVQAEPTLGGKYRIVVAPVIDKTDPASDDSIARQLNGLNVGREGYQQLQPRAITDGVRDMLITDLFGSTRFIVLERELDHVIVEQEFSQSARAGEATRIPPKQLEGAELMVLAAITGFDAGTEGGAIPIPIPFKIGRHQDFGILNIAYKRGFVAMDLRVVDARTGRILSSVAVQGKNTRFGADFTGFVDIGYRYVKLPGILTFFSNTPVEQALQKMVTAAVDHIAAHTVGK